VGGVPAASNGSGAAPLSASVRSSLAQMLMQELAGSEGEEDEPAPEGGRTEEASATAGGAAMQLTGLSLAEAIPASAAGGDVTVGGGAVPHP
jgi:hypothetical protein